MTPEEIETLSDPATIAALATHPERDAILADLAERLRAARAELETVEAQVKAASEHHVAALKAIREAAVSDASNAADATIETVRRTFAAVADEVGRLRAEALERGRASGDWFAVHTALTLPRVERVSIVESIAAEIEDVSLVPRELMSPSLPLIVEALERGDAVPGVRPVVRHRAVFR